MSAGPRYWLTSKVGSLRIRYEVSRDVYRAAHAKAFPNEHGPDFDPPDDPDWWVSRQLCRYIEGWRDGKWTVLLPSISISHGGYIDDWSAA